MVKPARSNIFEQDQLEHLHIYDTDRITPRDYLSAMMEANISLPREQFILVLII